VSDEELRQVHAACTDQTITVYQAYAPPIAQAAVQAGTYVPPFSRDRMTWIKPSFGWMMHRSGWAGQPGQERVLAIEVTRAGFEWALAHSCLSHYEPGQHDSQQEEWICSVSDITATARHIGQLARVGRLAEAERELPAEQVYPLGPALVRQIGATPGNPAPAGAQAPGGAS
jgi:Domain of unknown function (DUF4291)